jgi:hypothetical protein
VSSGRDPNKLSLDLARLDHRDRTPGVRGPSRGGVRHLDVRTLLAGFSQLV